MGTGSTDRSEISSDFLCLRLQRLLTSSETVSSAAARAQTRSKPASKRPGSDSGPPGPARPKRVPTCQIGHAVSVDLKLVALEMFADQRQQRVQDSDGSGHGGGRRVSVACRRKRSRPDRVFRSGSPRTSERSVLMPLPLSRWPTRAKLKLALKFRPTKWSICLQCHSRGRRISMNTSSGLWGTRHVSHGATRGPRRRRRYLVVEDAHAVQRVQVLLQQGGSGGVEVDLVQLQHGHGHPEQSLVHRRLLETDGL